MTAERKPFGFEKGIPMHEQRKRQIGSITLVSHDHGSIYIDGAHLEPDTFIIDPETGTITVTLAYDEISISLGAES